MAVNERYEEEAMKLLSVTIPCYNSEAYMRNCIHSLLAGGEEVEIIIVDDGSSDGTGAIADEYAQKYPTIVKAVHQENGGHGEAVNAGLRNATGLYFNCLLYTSFPCDSFRPHRTFHESAAPDPGAAGEEALEF